MSVTSPQSLIPPSAPSHHIITPFICIYMDNLAYLDCPPDFIREWFPIN
jgi:hypothetical protein